MKKFKCTAYVNGNIYCGFTIEAINFANAHFVASHKIETDFDFFDLVMESYTLKFKEVK